MGSRNVVVTFLFADYINISLEIGQVPLNLIRLTDRMPGLWFSISP